MSKKQTAFRMRKMAEKDVPTVLRIESLSFPIAPWKSSTSFLKGNQGMSSVVEDGEGQVVGYLVLKSSRRTSAVEVTIIKMATDPIHRGRGVGTFALTWAKQFAAREKAQRLFLRVRKSNAAARGLYEREGFAEVRAVPEHYARGATVEERTAIEMKCRTEV